MNPIFFIGLFVGGALMWLLLSFLYKPIGSIVQKLLNDAKQVITEEDNQNENKGEKEI